jgi:drug/metabolite transporter (DMT)-like permease
LRQSREPIICILVSCDLADGDRGGVAVGRGVSDVLVAVNRLPIGPVSAIRECSALFGVLIGIFIMKEPFGTARVAGGLLMTLGIIVLSVL